MILMAGPTFLGLLREALPAALRACVAAEIRKDLVHQATGVVRAHLPEEAFTGRA
jgi:protein required for attachment to host cells